MVVLSALIYYFQRHESILLTKLFYTNSQGCFLCIWTSFSVTRWKSFHLFSHVPTHCRQTKLRIPKPTKINKLAHKLQIQHHICFKLIHRLREILLEPWIYPDWCSQAPELLVCVKVFSTEKSTWFTFRQESRKVDLLKKCCCRSSVHWTLVFETVFPSPKIQYFVSLF